MELAVTIGLDLGKSVFQVHGVDAGGAVVVQRRLTRGKLPTLFAKQPSRTGDFGDAHKTQIERDEQEGE